MMGRGTPFLKSSRNTFGISHLQEVTADVISYSSCLAACGQRWADAMDLLTQMRHQQLQWNLIVAGMDWD